MVVVDVVVAEVDVEAVAERLQTLAELTLAPSMAFRPQRSVTPH
jgi:hypothetical protein